MPAYSVIDGHNDLPWQIWKEADRDLSRYRLDEHTSGHTDLQRLREGCVSGQFWSVFVPSDQPEPDAVVQTLDQFDLTRRIIGQYADLELCRTADDVERAMADGRIASLIGVEGGHSIGGSLGILRVLHEMGMRYLTLTHNQHDGLGRLGDRCAAQ